MGLLTDVFAGEQHIPVELIAIAAILNPIWWCAKSDTEIVGIAASWVEDNAWPWGRFAIKADRRGQGIGKRLAIHSLQKTFAAGAEEIHLEARDVTVGILKKLGDQVTGEPEDFYGDPVTPLVLTRDAFVVAPV